MSLQTPRFRTTRFITGWGNYKGEEKDILKKLKFARVRIRSAYQGPATLALPKKVEENNMLCTMMLISRSDIYEFFTVSSIFSDLLETNV